MKISRSRLPECRTGHASGGPERGLQAASTRDDGSISLIPASLALATMKRRKRRAPGWLSSFALMLPLLLVTLFLTPRAQAQAPLGDLVFSVGTTIRNAGNQDWSFVLVGAVEPALLNGKRFAVYGKPGDVTSAASYTQRGTIFRQTDAGAINALLNQSVSLGQNLSTLSDALNTVLRRVPGITNQPLAQKVITLFQQAETDAATSAVIGLLTVSNPGLRLCYGQAFAETIAGLTTYEVREVNPATGIAGDVIGRVTITPGAPVILPAPGKPFHVATNHPDDHLVIKLRWGTPDALRRLSLLSYGFNVWRIPRADALAGNFLVLPPTLAQLYSNPAFKRVNQAPASTTKDFSAGSGAGAADDAADRTTYFVADDNGYRRNARPVPMGEPFVDGSEYYYFVTARDVLGRDGLVSLGGLGRACRRIPPVAPIDLSARDEVQVRPLPGGANTNEQRIRIKWVQNTNIAELVTHYWIYRWPNPAMALSNDVPPSVNRIGMVPHSAATNTGTYLDDGPGAPVTPGLSNFWYTVRAVSVAACDPLPSPHSPPVSAVLRQREGPPAATGIVRGSCGTPAVKYDFFSRDLNLDLPTNRWNYQLVCVRRDPGIAWVSFAVTNSRAGVTLLGPIYFPPGGDRVELDYTPANDRSPSTLDVGCTVGNYYGAVSRQALYHSESSPPNRQLWNLNFLAGQLLLTAISNTDPLLAAANGGAASFCVPAINPTPDESGTVTMRFDFPSRPPVLVQAASNGPNSGVWNDVAVAWPDANGVYAVSYPACLIGPLPSFRGCIVSLPSEGDCAQHITSGADGGRIAPIQVEFNTTPRTREYRLYRSVNDGPLTLLAQGAILHVAGRRVVRKDDTMPPSASRLCYFVQLLDEHGNPSPMSFIGCKEAKPEKPPTPTLAEPQAIGTAASPQVSLNWFCPTAGVHRFRVFIKVGPGAPPSGGGGGGGSGIISANLNFDAAKILTGYYSGIRKNVSAFALRDLVKYSEAQLTPPISASFGPGPQFTLTANVLADVPYQISVQALDAQEGESDPSTSWDFTWKPPTRPDLVPWPARPLPDVAVFDDRVSAVVFTNAQDNKLEDRRYPVGIRIGQFPIRLDASETIGTPDFIKYYRSPEASSDPNHHIFFRHTTDPARNGEPLLPIVVYRQQVTNAFFPRVSGDVAQVSPMLERIPWQAGAVANDPFALIIPDRLLAAGREYNADDGAYLYLRDQQPVLLGARYRYFVVRFKMNREVDYIIPAGEVEIPLGAL